ncbi:hypothetical protein I6A84_24745 [Frankia sp. CNm7]|uniref:Uncharacterized protein n=1 Tax=Frankia nepalensis TaxID=1836974 RepID=A0A937UNZ6_9ACTN|nr:hypothetical protein [Frankia nepalensis]MBL7501585.1 hypothetical protein [Frankia nepalensis]MBL7512862.1 hypothetical protein [Frankia nepalensis]MBL7521210.1 hypothetical protein [Frankia nepalensis]MBL7626745.1 hypothetical protein [Frankia nepalensis]
MSGTDPGPGSDRFEHAGPVGPGGGGWDPPGGAAGWGPRRVPRVAGKDSWDPPADDPLFGPLGPSTGGFSRPRADTPRPVEDGRPAGGGRSDGHPSGGGYDDGAYDDGQYDDDQDDDGQDDGAYDDGRDDDGEYEVEDDYGRGDEVFVAAPRRGPLFTADLGAVAPHRWSDDSDGPDAPDGHAGDESFDDDGYDDEDFDDGGPPRRRRWLRVLIPVLVLVVVAVTYRTMTSSDDGDGASNATPLPTVQPVPKNFLDSIVTDTDPVIAGEFFRDAVFPAGDHTYTRIAQKLDEGCPDLTGELGGALNRPAAAPAAPASTPAAPGASAPAASAPAASAPVTTAPVVTGPACRQLVRALYLGEPGEGGRRLLAGVAVLVVDNSETAKQASDLLGRRAGGVTPLPLPDGALPGGKISGPNGDNELRTATPFGHYAIVVQFAYSDGSAAGADDQAALAVAEDLRALATQPLEDRLLLGRGYRAPALGSDQSSAPSAAPSASATPSAGS